MVTPATAQNNHPEIERVLQQIKTYMTRSEGVIPTGASVIIHGIKTAYGTKNVYDSLSHYTTEVYTSERHGYIGCITFFITTGLVVINVANDKKAHCMYVYSDGCSTPAKKSKLRKNTLPEHHNIKIHTGNITITNKTHSRPICDADGVFIFTPH
jgi:hypothetical protein